MIQKNFWQPPEAEKGSLLANSLAHPLRGSRLTNFTPYIDPIYDIYITFIPIFIPVSTQYVLCLHVYTYIHVYLHVYLFSYVRLS